MKIKGIIFDMDGVVTQTATLHFKAWERVFNHFFKTINPLKYLPFTEEEYLLYLDGISREEGVKNFLKSRGIIPDKYIEDLCVIKNEEFLKEIKENEVKCFDDTLEFINHLSSLNVRFAIISSSKNCKLILKKSNIENLFSVCVDGEFAEKKGLSPKPSPDIFLEAAAQLNLLPEECMVIEDALSGVKAAKNGKFASVIALDRKDKLAKEFKLLSPDFILSDLSSKQIELYKCLENLEEKPNSAIQVLPDIFAHINNKKEIIIFLDYDGTLTPIVDKPEDAYLSLTMHNCLHKLSQNYLTTVISGRELSNLKERVNLPFVFYAGNHGFEFEGPENSNLHHQQGTQFIGEIQAVYHAIYKHLKDIKGCIIENKKFTLSVHYRLVCETKHAFISSTLDRILLDYPQLTRHFGKKVFEIRPNIEWNKGIASSAFLNWINKNNSEVIPIYIGDDTTDEDAFKEFNSKGVTIKVTKDAQKTHAHYVLPSPLDVEYFLNRLNDYRNEHE